MIGHDRANPRGTPGTVRSGYGPARLRDDLRPLAASAYGRITEDFKLSTGIWVHVRELRRTIIAHFAPLLRDAVIAGHDRDEVTVLLVPDVEPCPRSMEVARARTTRCFSGRSCAASFRSA
jgi:hypothetical protein